MVKDELDKKIDEALDYVINAHIPAPGHLVSALEKKILQQGSSTKRKLPLHSLIPAVAIILANAALLVKLTLYDLQWAGSMIEKFMLIYIGFSLVTLLGVFILFIDDLYKERARYFNTMKIIGG